LGKIGDDALVYRISSELAIVQTIDYITPVVDDPFAFGQVAAANALSDIYAMGATPVFALNLVGFPVRSLPIGHMEQILLGGVAIATEAGVTIAGGHSIEDPAPKYGLAVTGFVHPDRLVTKAGGHAGDVLFLTKPLGSGVMTTAFQSMGIAELEAEILPIMIALNRGASEAMVRIGATACTDVTGFGLLGHLHELARASGVAAQVKTSSIPILPRALDLASRGAISNGTRNNMRYLAEHVSWDLRVSAAQQVLLCDAQTSGGLLIAAPANLRAEMASALDQAGSISWTEIGELVVGTPGKLFVVS
jgi:selenide, water dikinase